MNAIEAFVGPIVAEVCNQAGKALLVDAYQPEELDPRLAIWDLPGADVLHSPKQLWAHVDYRAYRSAYYKAFPEAAFTGLVIDHIMNRRVARIKGFTYVRLLPISRGANSSHGALNEGWAVKYHSSPETRIINGASKALVQYADLADITKMLDIKGGGSFMDNVNEAQKLVDLPDEVGCRTRSATRA